MPTSGILSPIITADATLKAAISMTGVRPEAITPQDWQSASHALYRFLLDLSNKGINLWTIERKIIGLVPGKREYFLPDGTVDELNIQYRQITYASVPGQGSATSSSGNAANAFDSNLDTACTQTDVNGWIQFTFGTQVPVTSFGIMPNGDNYYNLVYEYSNDATTWTPIYTPGVQLYSDKQWTINEIDSPELALYYRVRETGGLILNIRQIMMGFNPQDIVISRCSRDQYASMPQKWLTQRQPTQIWVDRRINAPLLHLWPVPSFAWDQLVVYYHRHIQDIGALTNEIDIPLRWQQAILNKFAVQLMFILPGTDMTRMPALQALADSSEMTVAQEERDNSPIMINPGVSVYTQ